MKKIVLLLVCAALALSLTGCGCDHQWTEAGCTSPRTCTLCGKTEGEPLGHSWTEATCAAPKTCAVCCETEGEALPHAALSEANYQQGPICADCGAEVGEPLKAGFEKHGLVCDIEPGIPVTFEKFFAEDMVHSGTAVFTITDVRRMEPGGEYPARDGYAWYVISLDLQLTMPGRFNTYTNFCIEDYYDIELHDDSEVMEGDSKRYTVLWQGEKWDAWSSSQGKWGSWSGDSIRYEGTETLCLPEGYDGFVIGVRDGSQDWTDGAYVYDAVSDSEAHFFRLDGELVK